MNNIVNNIKKHRQNANMSQKELAKKVGITDSAISQYETGKRCPNIQILIKIANVYGCSVDDLI